MYKIKALVICAVVLLCGFAWANTQPGELVEQTGIQTNINLIKNPDIPANPRLQVNWTSGVLMIPDWTTDSVGLFDPYDGTFLRFFCKSPTAASPKNAIQGPDNNIYLADQVEDAVTMFDTLGNYLGVYASASDGLDNIRGIAFRGDHLFVCCYHGTTANRAVKEFSAPHTFVRNFIANYTGIDPFDILFLSDGKALFADAGTNDKIALHDTNGAYLSTVYGRAGLWPQQIQTDSVLPGAFLACLWDADSIIDFDLSGTITAACTLTYIKGVYRLGNGNLLATCNRGMYTINQSTGTYTLLNSVTGWQYIELYSLPSIGISEVNSVYPIGLVKIHPNPFKGQTAVRYQLSQPAHLSIKIYNCLGSEMRTLVNQNQSAGHYSINWDGKDNNGLIVPNGIYLCNLRTGQQTEYYQIIVVK